MDLERFIKAQELYYQIAYKELEEGYKQSHWMWFIFPQIIGLGYSEISDFYAIKSIEEAKEYIKHPILGKNLKEISKLLLLCTISADPSKVFGYPDNLKLCSSMTLFYEVSKELVFKQVLDKFFGGEEDKLTLDILEEMKEKSE